MPVGTSIVVDILPISRLVVIAVVLVIVMSVADRSVSAIKLHFLASPCWHYTAVGVFFFLYIRFIFRKYITPLCC